MNTNYHPTTNLTPAEIASPKGGAKVNLDIPHGVRVERQPASFINSANPSGDYVDPALYSKVQK
jgi:hypothetical protein